MNIENGKVFIREEQEIFRQHTQLQVKFPETDQKVLTNSEVEKPGLGL
jgi:hypothetical protein